MSIPISKERLQEHVALINAEQDAQKQCWNNGFARGQEAESSDELYKVTRAEVIVDSDADSYQQCSAYRTGFKNGFNKGCKKGRAQGRVQAVKKLEAQQEADWKKLEEVQWKGLGCTPRALTPENNSRSTGKRSVKEVPRSTDIFGFGKEHITPLNDLKSENLRPTHLWQNGIVLGGSEYQLVKLKRPGYTGKSCKRACIDFLQYFSFPP